MCMHKELCFSSTFEPIRLTPKAAMQCNAQPMFYCTVSSSNFPTLYICCAKNVL